MGIQINGSTDRITAIDGTIDFVSNIGNIGLITASRYELLDSITIGAGSTVIKTVNGKLGIGTDNPTVQLSISGAGSNSILVGSTDASGVSIGLDGDSNGDGSGSDYALLQHTNAGELKILNDNPSGSGPIIFGTPSEKLRIDSSGRIGIGIADPDAYQSSSRDLVIGKASDAAGITIRTGTSNGGYIRFADGTSGNQTYRGTIAYVHDGDYMTFATDSTEKVRIDSSGRLIIGDVDNANAHANADDLIIGNTGNDERSGITIVSDTDKDGAIHFSDGAGAGQLRGQIVYGHTWGSYNDVMVMYTAGSKSLHIQDDGDVILGEIGSVTYTEGSTEAQLRVVGDADNGRPGAISLFGFGNTSNEAHARINFQQQTTGSNGQTTARIEAINRSSAEDASDLVFYTEKAGASLAECARMTTRGQLLIQRTDAVSTNLSFDSVHLGIGDNYGPLNSYRTIGFGYRQNETSEYPASIGCQITDWAASTKAELVFATRNSTGQADVATERMRIKADGNIKIFNHLAVDKGFETLTGNGVNAKLQVNTGSNDYDGIMIGGGYNRSTIATGATYDLVLTSNAYPANATSAGIRFKCGSSGGGGPTERMKISPEGYVTKSNNPSFAAYRSQSGWSVGSDAEMVFNATRHNIGSHYSTSTGRFTAPVAGSYLFTLFTIHNTNVNSAYLRMFKNGARIYGSDIHFTYDQSGHWDNVAYSQIISLSANDYVSIFNGSSSVNYHGNHWQQFCGYLLG